MIFARINLIKVFLTSLLATLAYLVQDIHAIDRIKIQGYGNHCDFYEVQFGDICMDIAESFDIPSYELIETWNYEAGTWKWAGCNNLVAGVRICVSPGSKPPLKTNPNLQCGPESVGNRNCPLNACCSGYGYCGLSNEHCNTDPSQGEPCILNCDKVELEQCNGDQIERKVGYIASWGTRRQWYPVGFEAIQPGYSHIIFSFAVIDPHTFAIKFAHEDDPDLAQQVVERSHEYGAKVLVAVGGWDFSQNPRTRHIFSDMIATQENRNKFTESVLRFCQRYGFDGIDIDFEYPASIERNGPDSDTPNLTLLFKNMHHVLHFLGYEISVATPASYWFLHRFEIADIAKYVSFINVMTYDYHGPWDAALPSSESIAMPHTSIQDIENTLLLYKRAGVPFSKLNLGLAWYGRSYKLDDSSCRGYGCRIVGAGSPGLSGSPGDLGYFEIESILMNNEDIIVHFDAPTATKWFNFNGDLITFDDTDTLKTKISIAENYCFGGTMIWSIDLVTPSQISMVSDSYTDYLYVDDKEAVGIDGFYNKDALMRFIEGDEEDFDVTLLFDRKRRIPNLNNPLGLLPREDRIQLAIKLSEKLADRIFEFDHQDVIRRKYNPDESTFNDKRSQAYQDVDRDISKAFERISNAKSDKAYQEARRNFEALKNEKIRKFIERERPMDCVAVGITKTGSEVVIAGNVKKRPVRRNGKYEFGLVPEHHRIIKEVLANHFPGKFVESNVMVVKLNERASDLFNNAAPHAEMQLFKFFSARKKAEGTVVGVSKQLCKNCAHEFKSASHKYFEISGHELVRIAKRIKGDASRGQQNKAPKNWKRPIDIEVRHERVRKPSQVVIQKNNPLKPEFYSPHGNFKKSMKNNMKPRGHASAGNFIEEIVENHDREAGAYTEDVYNRSGSYTGRACAGAFAQVGVGRARAEASVCSAEARGPNAGASCHAGVGGVSAGVQLELAGAEANVAGIGVSLGLKANTGVHVGPDGASAEFLGFGVQMGPKCAFKTPVGDVSCNIM